MTAADVIVPAAILLTGILIMLICAYRAFSDAARRQREDQP